MNLEDKKKQLEESIEQLKSQHLQMIGALAMINNLIEESKLEESKEQEDADTGSN